MKVKRVEGGLLIPDEYLADFGEIEVLVKPFVIIIKPRTVTHPIDCTSTSSVKTQKAIQSEIVEEEQSSPPLRRSSPRALLEFIKHSDGWQGDDLDDLLEEVYALQ